MPIHSQYSSKTLEPERVGNTLEKCFLSIFSKDGFGNGQSKLRHAFVQPFGHGTIMQGKIGRTTSLHGLKVSGCASGACLLLLKIREIVCLFTGTKPVSMKRITALFLVLAACMGSAFSQSTLTSITYNKVPQPALMLELPYNQDIS